MIQLKCKGPCGEWKDEHDFHPDPSMMSGRRSACRACRAKECRDRRAKNRKADKRPRNMDAPNEAARAELAKSLCGVVQTYWHIPVSTDAPLRWRLA